MNNTTPPQIKGCYTEVVSEVEHYTDSLFRFRLSRSPQFRFRSGEFVMVGLPSEDKPIFRAYSVASPVWDEELEFYSIKVPDGPLTSKLQHIQRGDPILIKQKATGTLVHDALIPGERLWLFASGTGIAPFVSLIRDPETYEKFDHIFLIHGARYASELTYGYEATRQAKNCPLVGEYAQNQLVHYASSTRDDTEHRGRITTLMETGQLYQDLGVPALSAEDDRVMICGSSAMLNDVKLIVEQAGLVEGANSKPAEFVIERAFVS